VAKRADGNSCVDTFQVALGLCDRIGSGGDVYVNYSYAYKFYGRSRALHIFGSKKLVRFFPPTSLAHSFSRLRALISG